jgi:hypothetical protein
MVELIPYQHSPEEEEGSEEQSWTIHVPVGSASASRELSETSREDEPLVLRAPPQDGETETP